VDGWAGAGCWDRLSAGRPVRTSMGTARQKADGIRIAFKVYTLPLG